MKTHDGLTEFLYLLARDHLPTGVIRGILRDHVLASPDVTRTFSDEDLHRWARARADEILDVDEARL